MRTLPIPLPLDLVAELYSRAEYDTDGHLIWTGSVEYGAGVFRFNRVRYFARRLAWIDYYGTEPEGKVTAWCDAHLCIRGDHQWDAAQRRLADHEAAERLGKTLTGHCFREHDQSIHGAIDGRGRKFCRACDNVVRFNLRIERKAAAA